FLFTKPTNAALQFALATRLAGHDVAPEEIIVEPDAGKAASSTLDKMLINGGRNATVKLNMSEKATQQVVLPVEIPADQKPGTYRGVLHIKLPQGTNVIAPADLQYTLEVLPSPWEQVSPIAVPIMILLAVVLLLWLVVWIGAKRS